MKVSSIISRCKKRIAVIIEDIELFLLYALLTAFIAGIVVASICGFDTAYIRPLLISAGVFTVISLLLRWPGWLVPVAMILGFGWYGVTTLQMDSFAGQPDEAVFLKGRVVEVSERAENYFSQLAEQEASGYSFIMQCEDANGWRGRVMVVSSPVQPKVGDRLRVAGIVYEFTETYNFNLLPNNYLRNNNIAAAVRPVPDGITFIRLAGASPYALAETVRERVFADMAALPDIQQALIRGMAFGDTGMLTGRQSSILQQTGIMHVFAVSGLHIGYIVLIGTAVMEFWRPKLRLPLWTGPLITAGLVVFFALVVGASPSVRRATMMALAALFCRGMGVRHRAGYALIIAAFILLLMEPLWIFQPGFLLSFAAAAGIVMGSFYLRQLIPSRVLAISLAAQLMTMPILAYFFSTVSLIGVLLSPLVVIAVGFVVILALLAMLLSFCGLAYIPLVGAGLLAELIYKVTELFAALPNVFTYAVRPSVVVMVLYYVLLWVACRCLKKAELITFAEEMRDYYGGSGYVRKN